MAKVTAKDYERTPAGFLMRKYHNMSCRVRGVQPAKRHIYQGLEILPREDFYEWAMDNPQFWRLYRRWVMSGYDKKLTPSINRIDSMKGYVPGNLEFVTHSVNSALANRSTRRALERVRAIAAA